MNKFKAMRERTGLNQSDFWGRVGVTQSGGSRYEAGRRLSKPIQMLVALAYGPKKEQQAVLRQLKADRKS